MDWVKIPFLGDPSSNYVKSCFGNRRFSIRDFILGLLSCFEQTEKMNIKIGE